MDFFLKQQKVTTTMAFGITAAWPARFLQRTEDGHSGRRHAPGAAGERCLPILPPPNCVSTASSHSSGTSDFSILKNDFRLSWRYFSFPKESCGRTLQPNTTQPLRCRIRLLRWWHAGAGGRRLFRSIARLRGILEVGRRSEAWQRSVPRSPRWWWRVAENLQKWSEMEGRSPSLFTYVCVCIIT